MGASITFNRRLDWLATDAAGYWHHSTFWTFAEAGEVELMRSLGIRDLVFGHTPRRSLNAEFHRPVYFDDEVTVTFWVEQVGRTSVTYRIRADVRGELAAEGTMVAVLVDDTGRPRPWPDEARALLAS